MLTVKVACPYELKKANETDAGWDLRSMETIEVKFGDVITVDTGCCIDMTESPGRPVHSFMMACAINDYGYPAGLEVQVRGRSSMAKKGFMTHLGTVDATYHSPIKVVLVYLGKLPYTIEKGHAIAQLVFTTFLPVETVLVESLTEDRGGFGSSDQEETSKDS